MATKEEIQAHIAKKLESTYEIAVDGAFVRDAVAGNINMSDWNAIADWLKGRDFHAIGRHVGHKVRDKIVADAKAEAEIMLSNESLDLTEYSRIEKL